MAARATCPRLSVGAVVVDTQNSILTTGYNGAPRGVPDCLEVGCALVDNRCLRAVHAEVNSVVQGARVGVSLLGGTMYTRYFPCARCALVIVQAGIRGVFYREVHSTASAAPALAAEILEQGGVACRRL
jgi:dCMP deaminase